MQIVIDIPEKIYNDIRTKNEHGIIFNAVKNGTPLPKGHGRLIDADELYDGFIDGTEGYDCQTWNRIEIGDIIEDVPTIIEADKAESECKECCDVCFYSDEEQASPSVRMMGCRRRVSYEIKKGYERGFMEGQKNPLFGEILDLKEGEEVKE